MVLAQAVFEGIVSVAPKRGALAIDSIESVGAIVVQSVKKLEMLSVTELPKVNAEVLMVPNALSLQVPVQAPLFKSLVLAKAVAVKLLGVRSDDPVNGVST